MSYNFPKNSFLIFYIIVFLITFFLVFGINSALAEESSACPPNCTPDSGSPSPVSSGGTKYIRLQIYLPIPKYVHSCTYYVDVMKNGKVEPDQRQCYYVESNLPLFIKKAYSFSIGIIAIIAVIMIMIGGVRWILAAGNPGTIGEAQNTIKAAVSGLILALLSYAILYTINPNLVNLQLTQPSQVKTIQQSSNWCTATTLIRPKLPANAQGPVEDFKAGPGNCGQEYEIKDTKDAFGNNLKTCWGSGGCEDGKICYQYAFGALPFCYSGSELCINNDKKSCDNADVIIQEYLKKYGCALRKDTLGLDSLNADECVYNTVSICNKTNQIRISCSDIKAKDVCWQESGDGQKTYSVANASIYCVGRDKRAIYGASYACCANNDGTVEVSNYGPNADRSDQENNLCSKISICSNYKNEDSCGRDDCGIGPCKWLTNTCVSSQMPPIP